MQIPKNKRVIDKKYVKWIKEQFCVISHQEATIHHLINYGTSGSSMKSDDYLSFPLSNHYHTGDEGIHRGVNKWEDKWQPQPYYIMATLDKALNECIIGLDLHDRYYEICEKLLITFEKNI